MSLIFEIPPGTSSQVYLRFPYASAVCHGKYVCRICTVIFLFPSKKSLSRSNSRLRPNYRVYCVHNYLLQRSVIPSHTFTGEVLVSLKHRAYLIKRHPYCSTERVLNMCRANFIRGLRAFSLHVPMQIMLATSASVLSRWWWMCSGLTPPPDRCQGPVPGSSERRIWRFLSSQSNFFCIKDCTGTRPTHHREMAIRRVGDLLNGVSGDRCCDALHVTLH